MDNLINYPYINEYLDSVIPKSGGILSELEEYAAENHIPIIFKEVKKLFEVFLPLISPSKILEVGTAIGYSSILFASLCPNADITTIEIDNDMFEMAISNIGKTEFQERITVINDDAANILPYLKTSYDFIFVDAAKGQYMDYYKWSKELVKPDGFIFFDNVLYKGLPANPQLVTHKHRTIANNLRDFNFKIMNDKDFTSSLIPIGDGIIISRKDN